LGFFAATPGRARRVPAKETNEDEMDAKAAEVEESEMTDSDAENKLNPDEYEDDTTEFEQSEAGAANESQNEVCLVLDVSVKYVENAYFLERLPFCACFKCVV